MTNEDNYETNDFEVLSDGDTSEHDRCLSPVNGSPCTVASSLQSLDSQASNSTTSLEYDETTFKPRDWVIPHISSILQSISRALSNKTRASIQIKSRTRKSSKHAYDESNLMIRRMHQCRVQKLTYPCDNVEKNMRFLVVVRILELILEALKIDIMTTKRDLYYKDVKLFKSQATVDKAIDDLACTFNIQRRCLHVIAAAKGLVYGPLTVCRTNIPDLNCSVDPKGSLIPVLSCTDRLVFGGISYLLIIEKEATFNAVCASEFISNSPAGQGLALTVCEVLSIFSNARVKGIRMLPLENLRDASRIHCCLHPSLSSAQFRSILWSTMILMDLKS